MDIYIVEEKSVLLRDHVEQIFLLDKKCMDGKILYKIFIKGSEYRGVIFTARLCKTGDLYI